jgi:hypothetical protein
MPETYLATNIHGILFSNKLKNLLALLKAESEMLRIMVTCETQPTIVVDLNHLQSYFPYRSIGDNRYLLSFPIPSSDRGVYTLGIGIIIKV